MPLNSLTESRHLIVILSDLERADFRSTICVSFLHRLSVGVAYIKREATIEAVVIKVSRTWRVALRSLSALMHLIIAGASFASLSVFSKIDFWPSRRKQRR